MSQLQLFTYADKYPFNVILIDGNPHFVGKEICDALGYKDPTTAMRSHCRGVQKLHPISDSLGRLQETRIVSEPDMLRLIVNSTLPSAQEFERWVFEEVLPSIRKTGSYGVLTAPQNFADALQLAADQQREIQRQQELLAIAAPKVELANAVIADASLMALSEVATELGQKRKSFFEVLEKAKWIFKRQQFDSVKTGPWLPFADKERNGLLVLKKRPDERGMLRDQTLVTGKGSAEIQRLFA